MPDAEPQERPDHDPQYVFEEGKFYCDGILVMPWQMTPEEIKQYVPREYLDRYMPPGHLPCPFDACDFQITGKSEWTTHFRFKHSEFFEVWGKDMSTSCNSYDELKRFVLERKDA
jgi:hypothetical protein